MTQYSRCREYCGTQYRVSPPVPVSIVGNLPCRAKNAQTWSELTNGQFDLYEAHVVPAPLGKAMQTLGSYVFRGLDTIERPCLFWVYDDEGGQDARMSLPQ